jgi:D-3-phosphoglycerate dehydrogenase
MMTNERERFDRTLRDLAIEPVWAPDHVQYGQFLDEAQCMRLVGDIDGWLAGDDVVTVMVLERALPRLKVISKWGTGLDSIDCAAARRLGIPVLNSPGYFADAVAEVAIGLILASTRQLFLVDRAIRSGEWPKPRGHELAETTLGMIGLGAIGSRIAELAQAFRMNVIHHDPNVDGSVAPQEIARRSDVVCLACAATPENYHLVNAAFLASMKPTALLVNVARGQLVDEQALIAALEAGAIAGAALDVFEHEPLPIDSRLRRLDNVVLSSHNANNGVRAVEAVHVNTIRNLQVGLNMAH